MSISKWLAGMVLASLAAPVAFAADAQTPAADADIAALVEKLDAEQFSQRQAASEKLGELGKPAIPALTKAAAGDSLEVTSRAIEILKKLYQSPDEATQAAAKEALETLAQGSHAPSARRAKEVLRIKEGGAEAANVPGGGIIIGGMGGGIIQGNIQIQVAANAGRKKVSVRNTNGVKEIDVEEGDKKIRIVEDDKGIKTEITTKKDGKDVTEKIEAKDADDLKKKSKEAYDIYKEYGQNQGGAVQVQIGAVPGFPFPIAQPVRVPKTQIDLVPSTLKGWTQLLPRLASQENVDKASKETIDEIQKGLDELKKEISELENRLKKQAEKPAEETEAKPAPARSSSN